MLDHLLASYGYAALFAGVALESCGVPLPGEALLAVAAVDAGANGRLSIWAVVAVAAAAGVVGDNLGYLVGRVVGWPLVRRYGRYVGLGASRLRVGRYLFARHGGAVVLLGRFVAVLRAYGALLAGVNRMPWRRFVLANTVGGVLWAAAWGFGGYAFGSALARFRGPIDLIVIGAVLAGLGVLVIRGRTHWRRLVQQAEREA